MANRFPLVLDTTDNNKIKEIQAGDNLNLTDNSITGVQNITALGTIDAADIRVAGNRLVAQTFADLTDTPATFVGSPNYFVKVKADGTGLEYRPLSDLGNIEIDTITVDTSIVPTIDGTGNIGTADFKFNEIFANQIKANLVSYGGSTVFDASTGKISYTALQGSPTFLSEFTDDIGFLRTADLDTTLAGLFDEGVPFETDIVGSVFADDSTLLVDAVAGKIVGDIDFGTSAGFIEGDQIVILPTEGNAVDIGTARLLDTLTPQNVGGGAIGTEEFPFNEANFITVNTDNISTDTVNLNETIGVAQLTATSDLDIAAGNRVKITGGVPFKFANTTTEEQLAIGAQEGDVIYNTTTNRLQMYQGGAWKDVNGNTEITTGESTFNDVVIAGNLTVNGTTTTVNTTNTTISDNVITLNDGEVGAGVTNTTAGIEIDRGSLDNRSLVWSESFGGKWVVTEDASFFANRLEANYVVGSLSVSTDNVIMTTGNITATDTLELAANGLVQVVSITTDIELLPVGRVYVEGNLDVTGSITAPSITSDLTGSVFADDSAVMVDAVNGTLHGNLTGNVTGNITTNSIVSTSGNITIEADNYVIIDSANNGQIDIGQTSGAGNVVIGNKANGTNVSIRGDVTMAAGTTLTLTGASVTGAAFDLTGNIDNAALTVGATAATTIAIGNAGSTTTINGIVNLLALVSSNITADDSISITTATGDGNAISLTPQGTNTAINLTADNLAFNGSITSTINAQGGIIGDLTGSVVADDSTVLIDGVAGKIVGPIDTTTITGTIISGTVISGTVITASTGTKTSLIENLDSDDDLNVNIDGFININAGYDDGTGLSKIQLDKVGINYIELTTEPVNPGNPADVANIAINATSSGGDVVIGSAASSRNQIVTINNAVITGDLTGTVTGTVTGALTGDVVGSVFADDSAVMVDALNYAMFSDTLTLTPLNAPPGNPTNGMIAVADGTGWNPAANAKNTLVAYLGGAWVTVAAAA